MAPTHPSTSSPVSPRLSSAVGGLTSGTETLPMLPLMNSSTAPDPVKLLDSLDHLRREGVGGLGSGTSGISNNSGGSVDSSETKKFDPIEFLNRHYTSEQSLVTQLPLLRDAVLERMNRLDDRISNAMQRQSETAESTRRHVQEARASVIELDQRIRQVKDKASQSERAVLEITKDMKRLDCAKRHLQRTITTLKQLHMLVHAVEQLRITCAAVPYPDYPTAAQLVDATRLLLAHFEGYTHKVEQMRLLSQRVADLQGDLRKSLVRGFRIVAFGTKKTREMEGTLPPKQTTSFLEADSQEDDEDDAVPLMTPDVMKGGVQLIDALGDDVRAQFIHGFCQDQLSDYLQQFEPPQHEPKSETKRVSSFKVQEPKEEERSGAKLDHVEERFIWFREILRQADRKFPKVFPTHWNLHASLARHFLQLTRDHILALLDGPRKDPSANNATVLLKALQKTIIFEKDITLWLQREYGTVFQDAKAVKKEGDADATLVSRSGLAPLMGVASVAFENYMRPYIELEEESMDKHLVEALEDRTVDTRGERPVFISSTNLFVNIKGSITRCTALTRGKAFFLLYRAFQDSLHKYAQILNCKLPPPVASQGATVVGGLSLAGSFGNKQENNQAHSATYRVSKGEEVTVCHVISTCEYCADTVEALEDLIRDTIDQEFKTKVDMISDQEKFHDITAKSIRVLVSGLIGRLDGSFKLIATTNWAMWEAVGEESNYVRVMQEEIEPYVKTVRILLPSSYFRSFCDKFASSFTATFWDSLIRLKKINEPGTQQLLLDIYSLKTLLLKLPILEEPSSPGQKPLSTGSTIAPAMYTKFVHKQFGRIETLLKLVGTPTELLISNFREQWSGGSQLDLQIVMTLKGMKRPEQAAMLEQFGLDPANAMKGAAAGITSASIVSERVQALQEQGSTVAAKVNSDLNQMRQKVDDFRRTFRT